ncbi:hypothetical protein CRI77_26610 [Mycolicibacterium duvalii]|nr:hypothetical protein [Mycolicibacterium duvalii]MCV7370440.1 hypothetical protein [Mycolicibacterium duvalii]PEG34766.1 hypothetical protein CRI77_26610 [Mycolicibacterium duvalii]
MERSDAVSVAAVVPTPELLVQMTRQKPACWAWAAFASALFQRWALLEARKVRQVLGGAGPPAERIDRAQDIACFVTEQMRGVDDIVAEVNAFLAGPTFATAFGDPADARAGDADGILRAAEYLGDCYERMLETAERCRSYSVPGPYAALLADCTRFANQHLQDFGAFINDVLARLEQLQNQVMLCQKPTPHDALRVRTTTDATLIWSILDRVRAME